MPDQVYISICIPAYKRTEFLKRLLDSIAIQTFRQFEVIITDDSPDNSVHELSELNQQRFTLHYYRNATALGTPENWNEAMRKARGQWIKLMHDDDWLAHENSLQEFANAISKNPSADFFFSAYRNVDLLDGRAGEVFLTPPVLKKILDNPLCLMVRNDIGHPSVTLYRNDPRFVYDNNIKWVVDIEFYIRCFLQTRPVYIPQVLVNIGLGEHQVTRDTFRVRAIEVPENFYLLNKLGAGVMRNWRVYDSWWRLLRNLSIAEEKEIREAGYGGDIEPVISSMLQWHRKIPRSVLTTGVSSKMLMFIHYLLHKHQLPRR